MDLSRSVVSGVLVCLLVACSPLVFTGNESEVVALETPSVVYRKITADEAKTIMDSGEPFVLLDVRTLEEYLEKRIDGALLIPDYDIKDRAELELLDKNALILIYCRSGRRSANAAHEMIEMGYSNVFDFGGIMDWPFDTIEN